MDSTTAYFISFVLIALGIAGFLFAEPLARRAKSAVQPADPALALKQNKQRIVIASVVIAVLGLFLAISTALATPPQRDLPPDGALEFGEPAQAVHPPGTTLRYTRSTQDGDKPETILVHIVSPTELAVAKIVERCKDAALVTAVFDPKTGEATRLVGGRLGKDGKQEPQAYIDLNAKTRKLEVRLGADPKAAPSETLDAPPAPWRVYDFDFADFALFGPRTPQDFSFGLALAWPDGSTPLVRTLGAAEATLIDSGMRGGSPFALYALSGPAFTDGAGEDLGGLLTLDPDYGHVIEARLGRPNHPGYEDLLLKLDAIEYGDQEWRDELDFHWKDCPR